MRVNRSDTSSLTVSKKELEEMSLDRFLLGYINLQKTVVLCSSP